MFNNLINSIFAFQINKTYWKIVGSKGRKVMRQSSKNFTGNDGHWSRIWRKGEIFKENCFLNFKAWGFKLRDSRLCKNLIQVKIMRNTKSNHFPGLNSKLIICLQVKK